MLLPSLLAKVMAISLLSVWPLLLHEWPGGVQTQQASKQSQAEPSQVYKDADSCQIYAALLQKESYSLYVIQAEINGYPNMTANNLGIKGDRSFTRVWGVVMKDYARQNRTSWLLARNIPIDIPYELLPLSDIFKSEHGQRGWDEFYRRFPSSGGFYWFSAVGFNPQRTRALVKMNHNCGMLCGGGEPHFFEKKGAKWHEVSVNAEVEVWAS
jgi:hypothetical protein